MMALLIVAALATVAALWLADPRTGAAAAAERGSKRRRHTNRLAHATSPYLLQHAHNPVDWYAWGPEPFEKARREDKPIFLSVGYSTCHWCHVMAHESFEDEEVARVLNEHFVCIKVDREQRPDVDEQYMLATQLFFQMIGAPRSGGWPNSVWLTPDGRPWYAGTYFPRAQFLQVLDQLHGFWVDRREDVERQADQLAAAIRHIGSGEHLKQAQRPLSPAVVNRAIEQFIGAYDEQRGGFGSAPKFPPHGALALLLDRQSRRAGNGDPQRMSIITHTLDAMAAGGVYDHVGGGFHRYATDARWFLPHFEKMLYDNAQLIAAYAEAHELSGREGYRRVIDETFGWLRREMTDAKGGFYSALDADSEGEEGRYYLWTHRQITEALGRADGELLARVYGASEEGNYREEATGHRTGANILYLPRSIDEVAEEIGVDAAALRQRLKAMRGKLLELRNRRVRPHLDDKVLSGWNGLMIGALARAGRLLEEPDYTDAAARAAGFVLMYMRADGRLLRTWRDGRAEQPAYLDDYAYLAWGLLELHRATGERRWLDEARSLAETMVEQFHDERGGGFYLTGERHDDLLVRAKELGGGGNVPAGNGVAAEALVRLAELSDGEQVERYAALAAGTLHTFRGSMWANPHGNEALLLAAARFFEAREAGRIPEVDPPDAAVESGADAVASNGPLRVEAFVSARSAAPGDTVYAALRFGIEDGWHIYGPDVGVAPAKPTAISLPEEAPAALGEVRFPEPARKEDPFFHTVLPTYEGEVTMLAEVKLSERATAGRTEIILNVQAQACSEAQKVCVDAPVTVKLPIEIDPEADRPGASGLRHERVFRPLGVGGDFSGAEKD